MTSSANFFQQVGPKATPGVTAGAPAGASTAQEAAPAPAGQQSQQPGPGNTLVMLAPIFLVMIVMLFMNRSQRKKDADTRAKLKRGDRVVTQSGLIGELVEMDDRIAKVKIAPGTNVSMLISVVSPYEGAAAKTDDKQLKDLKDAKAAAATAGASSGKK